MGQRKAEHGSFFHIGIQHGHGFGVVFIHQYVYVGWIQPMKSELHSGKADEALVDSVCREAYRFVLGAVAWTVLTRAELAVCVQVLQRRAHAPRVIDCKILNLVIRYMENHKCGLTQLY